MIGRDNKSAPYSCKAQNELIRITSIKDFYEIQDLKHKMMLLIDNTI